MKIVEVNDNDIYGKVFNGYDIAESFNEKGGYEVKQLVVNKFSDSKNVKSLLKSKKGLDYQYRLQILEHDILSVHSLISITSDYLENNSYYQKADLVHYHQFHNTHLNLTKLLEMSKKKPSVISLHDTWFMTGRCVHPDVCEKWKTGCDNCQNLKTLFDFSEDNCHELWKIKKEVLENADLDIIVPSKFIYEMTQKNPYMKNLNIHVLPFGIDLEKYKGTKDKNSSKEELGINCEKKVIFFREAEEKGTKYIVEALKRINNKDDIILLTCSQKGLLKEISQEFEIIELGNIPEDKIIQCYNAADVFLMPSLGESFGMMAIEAMASSLPVIVFNNTSLPSVTFAPEVGILVENKNSDDLYQKIESILQDDEERIRRGKLGRKYAEKYYDKKIYEQKLEEIYLKAYDRQKYKLLSKTNNSKMKIDYKNPEVQKVLIELEKIYKCLLPDEKNIKIFQNINRNINYKKNGIKFSDKNVQNTILVFNKELYRKIYYIESKKEISIKETWIYKLLKKSKFLRKIVYVVRGQKIKELEAIIYAQNNLITSVQNNLITLKKETLSIKSENIKFKKKLEALKDEINSSALNENRIENEFYKMYNALEYKVWNFNNSLNKILYENTLKQSKKIRNFHPLVSLIIPAYNAENYMKEAIDSALNQTYDNIEIIVVNDGSNDNGATRKIAESYGNKIKYYEKENGGVSTALNMGISKMKGEYFAWLSHDDLIDKNHIEKLVEFVSYEDNNNKIPYTNFKIIDEKGKININETIIAQLNCSDYKTSITNNYYTLLQGEINGGSVLIPKIAFKKVGMFDENLRISQERDLWSRLIKYYKFINIPYDTATTRVHKSQVSNTSNKVMKESNEKNLSILNNLKEKEILEIETNIDIFWQKMKLFYEMNNNQYVSKKIDEIINNEK